MEKAITARDNQQSTKEGEQETAAAVARATEPTMTLQSRVQALLAALRPRQWTKNFAVFIGIVFAQQLFSIPAFERAVIAFVTFCLASSSTYLLNDLLDLENDRQHPVKRLRPLASGRLPVAWAMVAIGVLVLLCGCCALLLFRIPVQSHHDIFAALGGANLLFTLIIIAYLTLMVLYSVRLKHVVLVDVFIIASGFILRVLAGAIALPVSISPWLYLVTTFLSLFLALSKRRHELVLLQGQASNHRKILKEYSIPLLDQMITIVVAATIIAYSLYTVQGVTGNHRLMVTVPLVLYGMFRYLYLVYMRMEGGSPEEVLLRDRHMLGTVLLCTILIIVVLYILPR